GRQYSCPARWSMYFSSSSFLTPLIAPLSATPISSFPPLLLANATKVLAIFSQLLILFLKSSCAPSPCAINALMVTAGSLFNLIDDGPKVSQKISKQKVLLCIPRSTGLGVYFSILVYSYFL